MLKILVLLFGPLIYCLTLPFLFAVDNWEHTIGQNIIWRVISTFFYFLGGILVSAILTPLAVIAFIIFFIQYLGYYLVGLAICCFCFQPCRDICYNSDGDDNDDDYDGLLARENQERARREIELNMQRDNEIGISDINLNVSIERFK